VPWKTHPPDVAVQGPGDTSARALSARSNGTLAPGLTTEVGGGAVDEVLVGAGDADRVVEVLVGGGDSDREHPAASNVAPDTASSMNERVTTRTGTAISPGSRAAALTARRRFRQTV
jgi:hypothetical protein